VNFDPKVPESIEGRCCREKASVSDRCLTTAAAIIASVLAITAFPSVAEMITFDQDLPGVPPAGWETGVTGTGRPKWTVEIDPTAPSAPNVLKQSGSGTFPWCIRKDVAWADGSVEVKFKPIAGKQDQAGGVVWRFKDENTYYVARANALENNVSLYYTQKGKRYTIKYVDAPVAHDRWHLLKVEFNGTRINVLLDGERYIEADDRHISGPGTVGVWTKADSVTAFDDFSFAPAPR
jgi:hypothetical protein